MRKVRKPITMVSLETGLYIFSIYFPASISFWAYPFLSGLELMFNHFTNTLSHNTFIQSTFSLSYTDILLPFIYLN